LRRLEEVFFGVAALHFAWMQYFSLTVQAPLLLSQQQDAATQLFLFHLLAATAGLRWMILVIIYGTFIPNGWRRCAVNVGILAGAPLVLTVLCSVFQPLLWAHLPEVLLVQTMLVGVGASIAVFGSYKISELQKEAFEARQLGQYRLKELIGKGGMGEVRLAEHVMLKRRCAIKLIRPEQLTDPTIVSRFEREVQFTAELTHPNTVEIYDYGRADDGTFYYAMEYLPGLSLEEMVERHGPLEPGRAVRFLRQMCGALREAHGKGLIHRDIKPSNILVSERGGVPDVAKLLDFGLVQKPALDLTASKLTVYGTILGSPPYMAPEQAAGKEVDSRSDIYCLGGVAYFVLTGQPPFIRETAMQLLLAHAYETPQPLRSLRPEVPEDLERVVLRCLEKDPDRRFADVKLLEQALEACECVADWTEEQATAWWRQHPPAAPGQADTRPDSVLAATTV
jgi:serine/threonine-protein kinase